MTKAFVYIGANFRRLASAFRCYGCYGCYGCNGCYGFYGFKGFYGLWVYFIALLPPLASLALEDEFELAPINYSETVSDDAATRLRDKVVSGAVELDRSSEKAFLRDVLAAFEIPEASQLLVFSKTSLQNSHISPERPRALYFSDEVYIGWVQGGEIEIIAHDDRLGPTFYILKTPLNSFGTQQATSDSAESRVAGKPRFQLQREKQCLSCHAGSRTRGIPGFIARSVYPDARGFPLLQAGSFTTSFDSPIQQRWGGWYVTGEHGEQRHMGNSIATEDENGQVRLDLELGANLKTLEGRFNVSPYLRPTSDIVALLVLEHQLHLHNVFTTARHQTLRAEYRSQSMNRLLEIEKGELSESNARVVDHQAEKVVDALLFKDVASLGEDGVDGDSEFQAAFLRHAKPNRDGRSLRDFQLLNRLFKYRCSYMIYSRDFATLPPRVKTLVLSKLEAGLMEERPDGRYEYIGASERRKILSILRETKILPAG